MAQRTGYLMVDHRASPGLTEADALASGYDPKQCGEGKLFEADTLTCAHCKGTQVKNPLRTRERAKCHKCDYKYVCDGCAAAMNSPDYDHLPFERRVDITMDYAHKGITLGTPHELLLASRKELL